MMDAVSYAAFRNAESFAVRARKTRYRARSERDAGHLRYAAHLDRIADEYAERARQLRDHAWQAAK